MSGPRLVTLEEAAGLVGKGSSTLYRWVAAGQLVPFARDGDGRALFLDLDVYEAEREIRRRMLAGNVARAAPTPESKHS